MIRRSLDRMVPRNRTRMDFYDAFQKMIADYNTGATNAEAVFAQLVKFAKDLNEEEQRGIREQLDDEQLAIFDILTRPGPPLSKAEREQVKRLARELLDTLKAERLVLPQVAQPAADARCCLCSDSECVREPAAEIL
jgi:type I restriction enzyme R subunit